MIGNESKSAKLIRELKTGYAMYRWIGSINTVSVHVGRITETGTTRNDKLNVMFMDEFHVMIMTTQIEIYIVALEDRQEIMDEFR